MSRVLGLCVILLSLMVANPASSCAQDDSGGVVGFDVGELLASGWAEEYPGVWTRTDLGGERRIKAQGREAMIYVLESLRARAADLLVKDFEGSGKTPSLPYLISFAEEIEKAIDQIPTDKKARRPPCFQESHVSANVGSGPGCGVSASATATIESNAWCNDPQACTVLTYTSALGACGSGLPQTDIEDMCELVGLNENCSSYSQADFPFRCEAEAAALVACPNWTLDMVEYLHIEESDEACLGTGLCRC